MRKATTELNASERVLAGQYPSAEPLEPVQAPPASEFTNGQTADTVAAESSIEGNPITAATGSSGLNRSTVDPRTGVKVGRFIVDPDGNTMIEPEGGRTVPAGKGGVDTHTLYPNSSNYQRLNPQGHVNNPMPHAHGHLMGDGPGMQGQGPSIDLYGNVVPWASADAHWQIK